MYIDIGWPGGKNFQFNFQVLNCNPADSAISSPQGCGCKSNIVTTLHEKGVSVMLAGNMGEGAYNLISNYGIKVIRGCNGNTDEIVNEYLAGTVSDNQQLCSHHGHDHKNGHSCSH